MKTAIEVIRNIVQNCEGSEGKDEVRANKYISTNLREIEECCIKYAKEVIDAILEDNSMIYVELDDEANYNYEEFDKFKQTLE